MKYRAKLFLTFSILVALSTLLALIITYEGSARLLFDQIRAQLLSATVSSAMSFNGDVIEQFTTQQSTQTPTYQNLIEKMRVLRNTNRVPNFYIQYLYIIRYNPSYNNFTFIADAEENPQNVSHFGDVMPPLEDLYENLDKPFVVGSPYTDPWGTWFSAFAPIYDSHGKIVATLGMDMNAKEVYKKMRKLIFYGLIALAGALIISMIIAHSLSKLVTTSLSLICTTIEKIGAGDLSSRIYLNTKDEFDHLALAINSMAQGLEERNRLKIGFSRYVSQYVLDKILSSDKPTKLEGEKRKVTILFSDIRHFTTISERLAPEKVVALLNEYFEQMISIIFAHHGTLDKFIGDGIMAEFGAPIEDPNQELHAVKSAIHMQLMINALSKKWKKEGNPDIHVGIGIHSGFAIVGNIGSNIRMEYTAIGDSVNVASRLEQVTKTLDRSIIISEDTYKAIQHTSEFGFEDLGDIHLAGRESSIKAYAVLYDQSKTYDLPEPRPQLY